MEESVSYVQKFRDDLKNPRKPLNAYIYSFILLSIHPFDHLSSTYSIHSLQNFPYLESVVWAERETQNLWNRLENPEKEPRKKPS